MYPPKTSPGKEKPVVDPEKISQGIILISAMWYVYFQEAVDTKNPITENIHRMLGVGELLSFRRDRVCTL